MFVDETANPEMAEKVVINGKTQRPSVCNAVETLLIHENGWKTRRRFIKSTC